MKTLASAAIVIAAFQVTGVAVAGSLADVPRRQVVRFADLDLTREAGAATLLGRLQAAAREVCEPLKSEWLDSHRCMDQALARAVAEVNAPALTDRYIASTGRPLSAALSGTPVPGQRAQVAAGSAE